MADLPKYAIMFCDEPSRRMIAELFGDRYRYMVPREHCRRKLMRPPAVEGCEPTDIRLFGFYVDEFPHSVIFKRVAESAVTYPDGKPRRWQDRTFGANIGDSFEIQRRKR